MTGTHQSTFKVYGITRLSPISIVLIYGLSGLVWIVLSDSIAGVMSPDIGSYQYVSFLKGMLFLLLTSSLLYMLIRFLLKELQTSGTILQAAFQASPDAICITRLSDGTFLKINAGFTRISGYSEPDIIGKSASELSIWDTPADCLRLEKHLVHRLEVRDFSARFRTKDGSLLRGIVAAHKVKIEGEECVVSVVRDRTQELEAREEIDKLANYDPETGLPNHHLLMDRLSQVISLDMREKRKTVIIYISLTNHKAVVDVLGHSGGGEVMRAIAHSILSVLRPYDTVARIQRDEFVVMLGNLSHDGDVSLVLNRLQQIFALPLSVESGEFAIPACLGVACFPADGLTAEILIQNAHIAMNQARQAGISTQFYSESMNRKALERYAIETGMLRAIDDGEFFLCYQPKVAINGSDVTGMEALVRWRRPGEGIIPPDRFIPLAEENGMILRLGAWVLHEACRQNKAWQDAGLPPICISVNISARQLLEKSFVEQVIQVLESTGLSPRHLELELTESAVMANSEETVRKLIRLKELGVSISVDDFGTGYSSLSYLKHLPIDCIKVDRSFVRDIVSDSDDAAIVGAIIAMAHALGLRVIAEGVETVEQLEFLRNQHCNEAQGYYFSRPLESLAFEELLLRGLSSGELTVTVTPVTVPAAATPLATAASSDRGLAEVLPEPALHIIESIAEICLPTFPAHPSDNLSHVLKRFQTEKGLLVLPVVDQGCVIGILNRSTFLEEHVIGMHGFAFQINHSKKIRDLMNPEVVTLEAATPIKEAAEAIQGLGSDIRVDNVCVTRNGVYEGIIDVNRFISAITEINLTLAKGANPLTGLPGNESIQREITERLKFSPGFDIAYIDIDNFKPFNDYYGFQKGDVVIKVLGEIVRSATQEQSSFCGHIGGDDFIVITEPNMSHCVASAIIRAFEEHLSILHGERDFAAGRYSAANRKGETETFGLLSLSIGIVNTNLTKVGSYGQLASLSTEVKRLAKKQPGSSIVLNRRLQGDAGAVAGSGGSGSADGTHGKTDSNPVTSAGFASGYLDAFATISAP